MGAVCASVGGPVCVVDADEPEQWASRLVYSVVDGEPVFAAGDADTLTVGPFSGCLPWSDPASVLGKPNTLDYDDTTGPFVLPCALAGGPMRRVHLAWAAWQLGSSDVADLGGTPAFPGARRANGVGLVGGAVVTVAFDEVVVNNPDDGGAYHFGVDLVVHGNSFFSATRTVLAGDDLDSLALGSVNGAAPVANEGVLVEVAQFADGPWYSAPRRADGLFPTQAWGWEVSPGSTGGATGGWTGAEQDWGKPVDPALTAADFAGLPVSAAIALYDGSAGGTPVDLSDLRDGSGGVVSLDWVRFVRFSDPDGLGGEITGVADVPAGVTGVCAADLDGDGDSDSADALLAVQGVEFDGVMGVDFFDVLAFLEAAGACE